jgi:hypothetical protein
MITGGGQGKKVQASRAQDAVGKPRFYTLSYGEESVPLEPGKPWQKIDTFKWVTRGLIEEPQSFHVHPDGAVELNAERISLQDPEGITKLEHEINKHHAPSIAHHPPTISSAAAAENDEPVKVKFKVKFDHLGHLMIACTRGHERMETGLRGISGLVQGGFMIKPGELRVDPLQRAVEIDGTRFDCSEEGARQLEERLNAQYAPELKPDDHHLILVRDNPASATGYDVEFSSVHGGAKLEVKGHLSQARLDILQDRARCDLLRPQILLRLSPPYLLVRRRRSDGGEERIPEIGDVHYLRTTAAELQQVLNHPLVRRTGGPGEQQVTPPATVAAGPARLAGLRLVRNPKNRLFLWMECCDEQGAIVDGKAFTHHNVAELQHRGVFQPELDVSLSLDNHRLGILNKQSHQEQVIVVDPQSDDAELARAGQLLTAALPGARASL